MEQHDTILLKHQTRYDSSLLHDVGVPYSGLGCSGFTKLFYRPACGQIEARYPDRTCLVWYLCSHVLYLLAVHANLPVSGVRLSSPDSGPMCTYVGSWPSFWARVWGLVCELCLSFCLEDLQCGYLLGMGLWRPLPGVSCRWLVCLGCPSMSGPGI